jgi:hypothetical protein
MTRRFVDTMPVERPRRRLAMDTTLTPAPTPAIKTRPWRDRLAGFFAIAAVENLVSLLINGDAVFHATNMAILSGFAAFAVAWWVANTRALRNDPATYKARWRRFWAGVAIQMVALVVMLVTRTALYYVAESPGDLNPLRVLGLSVLAMWVFVAAAVWWPFGKEV